MAGRHVARCTGGGTTAVAPPPWPPPAPPLRPAPSSPLSAEQAQAELVLLNGRVLTVDDAFSIRQAVAVKDGRFAAVGSDADVRPWVGAETRVVDLGGKTVIPGLI